MRIRPLIFFGAVLLASLYTRTPASAEITQGQCICNIQITGAFRNQPCNLTNLPGGDRLKTISIPIGKELIVRSLFNGEHEKVLTGKVPSLGGPNRCPPGRFQDAWQGLQATGEPVKIKMTRDLCEGGLDETDWVPYTWELPNENLADGFYKLRISSCKFSSGGDAGTDTPILSTKPADYHGPLPDCAFFNIGCRNTNELLSLLVNIGNFIFAGIGTWALLAFVYGGVMMIISMGNSEQFTKGKDALVAAVIGLVIALSAYLIINFVLDALQVGSEFRPPASGSQSPATSSKP